MDYEIYPLAVTHPEWGVFVDVCQRVLGVSPTRGIDASRLNIKDPASFLGSLDMNNAPAEVLCDEHNPAHGHYSISFIMVLDDVAITLLASMGLKLLVKSGKRQKVVITTGSMQEWFIAIRSSCRHKAEYELRWIMNRVVEHFDRSGFGGLFSKYKKQKLHDTTFVLK